MRATKALLQGATTNGTSSIFEMVKSSLTDLKNIITGQAMWLTPRQQQELLDSKIALLALTQHKLRDEARKYRQQQQLQYSSDQEQKPSSSSSFNNYVEEANYYQELAIEKLENEGAESYGIDSLRNEIQTLLQEQTMKIFESFRSTELILNPSDTISNDDEEDRRDGGGALRIGQQQQQLTFAKRYKYRHIEQVSKPILLKDYATLNKLHELQYVPFRERKRQYMFQIMKNKKWDYYFTFDDDRNNEDSGISNNNKSGSTGKSTSTIGSDEESIMEQILMLTKVLLLKNDLGYSVLPLPSTIPNAGQGLFVDGRADIGSIVAFFPGEVWPREYLLERDFERNMLAHFSKDDNYELTFRYDDVLIDSRKQFIDPSVYINNPWAVAHLVNHPPPKIMYNCRPVMVNYMLESNDDYDLRLLKRYVPNTYARAPKFFGPKLVEGNVFMHGLVLITTRDVCNEELFMNYRLNPKGDYPSWYTICDEEESKKRWGL